MEPIELEIVQEELGLTSVTDPVALRDAINKRLSQMNALDRAAIQMRIGRRIKEGRAMAPGANYSPPSWALIMTCLVLVGLTGIAIYVMIDTQVWMIIKIVLGVFAGLWLLVAWKACARVIYRSVNRRDA